MTDAPDLYVIDIEVTTEPEPGHGEISVSFDYYPHKQLTQHFTLFEVIQARQFVAGILGRLGAELSNKATEELIEHGCHNAESRCGMVSTGLPIPNEDLGDLPTVCFTVPASRVNEWAELIDKTLLDIAKADAWMPTEEHAAKWRAFKE